MSPFYLDYDLDLSLIFLSIDEDLDLSTFYKAYRSLGLVAE
jgi:hypothetical protein